MTGRISRTRIRPYLLKKRRNAPNTPLPGVLERVTVLASTRKKKSPREIAPGGQFQWLAEWPAVTVLLDDDRLLEDELPVLHEITAELVDRCVAVLVDRVRAEHALLVLGLVD